MHIHKTHNFKTNSMRTPAILITAIQWCIQHTIHLAQLNPHKWSVLGESNRRSFDSMAANLIINLEFRATLMVPWPPQEPNHRLCAYDAAVLVVHPVSKKLRMHQFCVAHFQDSLAAPKYQPNHRPIRRETRCCHARLLFSF